MNSKDPNIEGEEFKDAIEQAMKTLGMDGEIEAIQLQTPAEIVNQAIRMIARSTGGFESFHAFLSAVTHAVWEAVSEGEFCARRAAVLSAGIATGIALTLQTEHAIETNATPQTFIAECVLPIMGDEDEWPELLHRRDAQIEADRLQAQFDLEVETDKVPAEEMWIDKEVN
jgi:hypothetical protein